MPFFRGYVFRSLSLFVLLLAALSASAQGNAGAVRGTVTDPSGAVIPGATVHISNTMSGLDRSATTDATGQFAFTTYFIPPGVASAKTAVPSS